MLGTYLAEVKHKEGLKLQHPEPLAHGRPLLAMINNRQATTAMLLSSTLQPAWLLSCRPAGHQLQHVLKTFSRSNRILSCWSYTWQKKNKKQKEETKL
jgi:hypothetical protein